MTRQDISEINSRLGNIRVDLSGIKVDTEAIFREINAINLRINDIGIKLDRDIIPYAATSAKVTPVLKNIEGILEKQRQSINSMHDKLNYGPLNFGRPTTPEASSSTPDYTQKIEEIKNRQEEFLNSLREKLAADNQLEKLTQIYYSIEQAKVLIEQRNQEILNKIESNSRDPDVQNILVHLGLLEEKLDSPLNMAPTQDHQAMILKLSDVGDDIGKLDTKLGTIGSSIDYLKVLTREPLDQSETHKNLKEILRQIQLLNVDEISRQLNKLFSETLSQTDFSYKFADAIKLEIRDRLMRIETNLYKFITLAPIIGTSTGTLVTETKLTTESYFIYTDGLAPDRPHFIR